MPVIVGGKEAGKGRREQCCDEYRRWINSNSSWWSLMQENTNVLIFIVIESTPFSINLKSVGYLLETVIIN